MPPAVKRNASVILYDVKTNSDFKQEAEKCLLNICALKWFTDSKDFTNLILLNTSESDNCIYNEHSKAEHITETTDDNIFYNPKLIQDKIQNVETAEGDWLMGLAVALEVIKDKLAEEKLMNIQLLLITDFLTQSDLKTKRLSYIVENLNELNVFLYIVGPKVRVTSVLKSFEDINLWSNNIEFCEDENPNLVAASYIVKNTNYSVICDVKLGEHLFNSYAHGWGLQPWKVPLTIGNSITMQCDTIRFLRKVSFGKWIQEGAKTPWKWHLSDDVLTEVPPENVIGGVFIHNKFVPLPSDVEKDFKYNKPRCFKIIAFVDKESIHDIYLQGDGSCVVTSDTSNSFKLLVSTLRKQNKCAIAYRIYMQGTQPKLVVLFPESDNDNLLLVELAYGNVTTEVLQQDVKDAPVIDKNNPAVQAMYDYLEKLDITKEENKNKDGSLKFQLASNLMIPYNLSSATQRCLQKYNGNEIDFEETNIVVPDFGNHHEQYKTYFSVREVPKEKKQK